MYLVKCLAAMNGPAFPGQTIAWVADQQELVANSVISFYREQASNFEVVSGPTFEDIVAAGTLAIQMGAAAPVDFVNGVKASLVRTSAGANNDLTFTAVAEGVGGNSLTVAVVQSVTPNAPLAVSFVSPNAVITLPADGAGAPVARTAMQVKAAWDVVPAALAAMTVAVEGTGAGNVAAAAQASLTSGVTEVPGTQGGLGTLYVSSTEKKLYIQVGTVAEPVWEVFTSA